MLKKIKHLRPDLSLSEFSSINIIEGNHAERKNSQRIRRFSERRRHKETFWVEKSELDDKMLN